MRQWRGHLAIHKTDIATAQQQHNQAWVMKRLMETVNGKWSDQEDGQFAALELNELCKRSGNLHGKQHNGVNTRTQMRALVLDAKPN